jgi:hypothetical protein
MHSFWSSDLLGMRPIDFDRRFPEQTDHLCSTEAAPAAFFFQASTFPGLTKFTHAFFCSVATPRSVVKRPLVAMVGSIVQMVRERGSRTMAEAHPGRVGRRLAAIVAADVAGYSRLRLFA